MTMMKSPVLRLAVLLALLSMVSAKILPFADPFLDDVPSSTDLQQSTKQVLNNRKLASARRSLKKSGSSSSKGDSSDMVRGLTTKKSGTRMSTGSSSKSSKKSSKSSKKSSSSKGESSSEMEESVPEPATEAPMISEDRIASDDGSGNINMSEDQIVSEDTGGNIVSEVTEGNIVSEDTGGNIVSEDTGGNIVSDDTDREGEDDPQEDETVEEGTDDLTQEPEDDAIDEEDNLDDDEPQSDDIIEGEETGVEDDGDEEPVEERIEEIFVDTFEFAMVRYEAATVDSQEDFNMTSVIAMNGLVHEVTADGAVLDIDSVGNFRAACTVTSLDHDVLCVYNLQILTPGEHGVGEFTARGHVVDHEAENGALVTGTSFDFERYTRGGILEMQPDTDDPLVLYCTLSLRYPRTRIISN